jgi:hypothetical protein
MLPQRGDYAGLSRSWRTDLIAGLTVGVVALPLALAFGITTGLGARAGLITAIIAGVVAAVFGGSNVQVSGPTGAMTVVLVPLVARYGVDAVYVVGVMAGVIVVISAFAGVGRLLAYIPWPVIEGFTVGIATIIFLQQVPAALGVPKPHGENTAAIAFRAVREAVAGDGSAATIAIASLVAIVMIFLPWLRRSLPVSLIAVVVATAVAQLAHLDISPHRQAARFAPRADLSEHHARQAQRPVQPCAGGRRARGDREPAVGKGRRRNGGHDSARPRPRTLRPGARQHRLAVVRRNARYRSDRPNGRQRPCRGADSGCRGDTPHWSSSPWCSSADRWSPRSRSPPWRAC